MLPILVALIAPPVDSYPKLKDLDVLHYRYELTFKDDADSIAVLAAVEARFRETGRSEIPLDLIDRRPDGSGMTVAQVSDSVGPLRFEHRAGRLTIRLRQPAVAGARTRYTISYHGRPGGGLKFGRTRTGDRAIASDNWPNLTRHWLATVDHPYDKATVEFAITAPAHYQVIANGLLIEETDGENGQRRTTWRHSVPIATWLFTLGVARYAVEHSGSVQGIPIQAWVYRADRDQGFADFGGPTKRALRFFSEWIGPYSYEKLANVESIAAGGGMEAATAIGYTERLVGAPRMAEVIVHEVAHHWWGNAVTEYDWNDVWLSEGFATYFTLLFTEYDAGREAFLEGLRRARATVLDYDAKHPGYRVIHANLTDMSQVTSSQTYQKGAWTLHMLRGIIGTDTFWRAIREYHQQFRDRNATTADFRRIVEEAAGRDLGWFFDQWLTRSGAPVIAAEWRYNAAAKQVELRLTQTQAGEPFRVPLEVGLRTGTTTRIERVELQGQSGVFLLSAEQQPTAVEIDPNFWVLMEATITRR